MRGPERWLTNILEEEGTCTGIPVSKSGLQLLQNGVVGPKSKASWRSYMTMKQEHDAGGTHVMLKRLCSCSHARRSLTAQDQLIG